jgi:hypothetical protein
VRERNYIDERVAIFVDAIRKSKHRPVEVRQHHHRARIGGVGIGNCSGDQVDKFERFSLTPVAGAKVAAPLIRECWANLECRIADARLVKKYNFFILEVVKAHVATAPKYPRTIHYRGKGIFITSGHVVDKREKFTKWKNTPNFQAKPARRNLNVFKLSGIS